jgi:CRISPR-associated protein Cas1
MRRLLNILYVTTQDSYLAKDGLNVCMKVEQEVRFRMPVHNLEGIVCFGRVSVSPALMALCAESGVAISFLTEHGAFQGRITGPVSGNVLLRRQQYRFADDQTISAKIASRVILAKLVNSRGVLARALRDHAQRIDAAAVADAVSSVTSQIGGLERCADVDAVRGVEGFASSIYFGAFDHLILENKNGFFFKARSRRPPLDAMNSLLSFLYTLLAHDVQSALETVGLDPAVGYLHRDRPGRPSLALDLMEELRAVLADRLALNLVNLRQVAPDGFTVKESGGVIMDDATRKVVLTEWQKRKQEEVRHPFLNETISIGLVPYAQALLLARFIRGDIEDYPPFIRK